MESLLHKVEGLMNGDIMYEYNNTTNYKVSRLTLFYSFDI